MSQSRVGQGGDGGGDVDPDGLDAAAALADVRAGFEVSDVHT